MFPARAAGNEPGSRSTAGGHLMNEKLQAERTLSIRVTMLPRDTNGMGSIFGGAILSYVDLAGAIEARRTARRRFVTKALHEVEFLAPVMVGDMVSFYTRTERVGTTSVTVQVEVEVERFATGRRDLVTTARVTFVAVDAEGRKIRVRDGRRAAARTRATPRATPRE